MLHSQLGVTQLEDRSTPATLPTGFALSVYTTGLDQPTALVEAPDGRLLVAEKQGELRVVEPDGSLLEQPALKLSVSAVAERGLLGVEVDPDFETNQYIYVYYTVPPTDTTLALNRISRFTMLGNVADPASEFVVADLDPTPNTHHNGGAIHFGPDGKLYVAVGDNTTPNKAHQLDSQFGKVLRFNKDGTIPTDNPALFDGFGSQVTTGKYRSIYAIGFRNPFTFAINPNTGRIFVNDVGQNAVEEVNDLAPGRDYGWPATEGPFPPSGQFETYTPPLLSYPHALGTDGGFAVAGATFYTPDTAKFPAEYVNNYFYADYVNGWIRRYNTATQTVSLFASGLTNFRIVDLDTTRGGDLLILDLGYVGNGNGDDGRIYRISLAGLPQISSQPDSLILQPGQDATFSVEASSDEPMTYQWQRNGVDIPDANSSSYTLANVQLSDSSDFRVVITNRFGSTTSTVGKLTVTTNQPPVPTILTPVVGSSVASGQQIAFSGVATDLEDGQLGPESMSWRVDYFTGPAAGRPLLSDTPGIQSGSVLIPSESPYTRTDVFYRVTLTVRDSFGNTRSTFRDVQAQIATVTLTSNFPGASFTLEGTTHEAPYVFDGVAGLDRQITAVSSYTQNGNRYNFVRWSDGVTTAERTISTPLVRGQFQAIYSETPIAASTKPPQNLIVLGSAGRAPIIRIMNASTGLEVGQFDLRTVFGASYASETRVAHADVTGDGIDDYIVGSGPGGPSTLVIINGVTLSAISLIAPFEASFTGGIFVTAGDLDGDGLAEVIVSPDVGGGPRIRVYRNGNPTQVMADFFGIEDVNFRGGARVSLGDLTGRGQNDLVVAAGIDGGPRVAAFEGRSVTTGLPLKLFNDFFAFEQSLRNGAYVTVGDLNGDGIGEIIAGGGPGGGPRVVAYSGAGLLQNQLVPLANFFAGNVENRNGVRLSVTDADGDRKADLVIGTAPGTDGKVLIYRAADLMPNGEFRASTVYTAFEDGFDGGVYVG